MKEKVIVPEKTTTIISDAPPADRDKNAPPVIKEKVIVPEKPATIISNASPADGGKNAPLL
jgi:hypothetical protein